jgi:hypothetical protein
MLTTTTCDPWDDFDGGIKRYKSEDRKTAIKNSRDGSVVKGYYSGIVLSPSADKNSNLYPTFDHVCCDNDDENMVIEAALINRLKTNLPRDDFWSVIRHLYIVGVKNEHIDPLDGKGELLQTDWEKIDLKLKNPPAKKKSFTAWLRDEFKTRSGDIGGKIPDSRAEAIIEKLFSEQPSLRNYLIDLLLAGGEQLVSELLAKIEQNRDELEKVKDLGTEGIGQPPTPVPEK